MTVYHSVFENNNCYIFADLCFTARKMLIVFHITIVSKKLCTYTNAEENQIKYQIKVSLRDA